MIVLSFLHIEHTLESCIIVTRSIVLSCVNDTPIHVYECLHSFATVNVSYIQV